jgi:hypothetical protein
MATSGTATFNLDVLDLVEEAFERAGLESRSGYDIKSARRSIDLMMLEWQNRGINMWTVDQGTVAMVQGTATYSLPADTIDLLEHVIRLNAGDTSSQIDYDLERISVSRYAVIPNKLTQGRPLQIYIDRQSTPQVTLWPIPDGSQTYTLMYYRLRRIEDTGTAANDMDVPTRFIPALVSGLAFHLAMKRPEVSQRAPALKVVYEEQFKLAAEEDREKADWHLTPYIPSLR